MYYILLQIVQRPCVIITSSKYCLTYKVPVKDPKLKNRVPISHVFGFSPQNFSSSINYEEREKGSRL